MQTVRIADTTGKFKDDYPVEINDHLDLEMFKSRINSLNIPYENYKRKRAPRIVLVLGIFAFGATINCIVMTQTKATSRFIVLVLSIILMLVSITWLFINLRRAKEEVANERERLINGFNSEDSSQDINWLFVKESRVGCIRPTDHLIIELGRPPSVRSLPLVQSMISEKGIHHTDDPLPPVYEVPGKTSKNVVGIE